MDLFCSVIIPVYNSEPYLKHCVDSILCQTDVPIELILVDDGSGDKSGAICDGYAALDSRVRVIHQPNGGHTAARNAGLKHATGMYIAYVDSDDWVDANWMQDCYQAVLESNYPDVILYGYRRHEQNGQRHDVGQKYQIGFYDRTSIEKHILPTLLISGRFSLCERLVKRTLMEKYQFSVDRRILLGEDLACCVCTLSEAQSLYVMPGVYYNYLQHAGSVSHFYGNYTFENWTRLKAYLDSNLAERLPRYESQIGYCSIRFLQRAVLGTLHRDGLHAAPKVARILGQPGTRKCVSDAVIPAGKRAHRFKRFCLKHRLVLTLWAADAAVQKLRSVKK